MRTLDNVTADAPLFNLLAYTLLGVNTWTLIETSVKVKSEALFNSLCNTLADRKTEPLRETLAGVKEKSWLILDSLGESVAELVAETLSETVKA